MGQVPCPAPEKTTHASGLIGGSNLTTLVYDAFRTAWLMPQGRGYASEDANKRGTWYVGYLTCLDVLPLTRIADNEVCNYIVRTLPKPLLWSWTGALN